jgi:hypothetical protein
MDKVNIRNMQIEIVSPDYESVEMNIGGIPAMIIEPKPFLTKQGIVFLFSPDLEKGDWEELIECTWGNEVMEGCTNDPRLVKIAETILTGRAVEELKPGTVIPPLGE